MSGASAPRQFLSSRRANAAIEFVLVLPLLLAIFAGILEFGRAFEVYGAVNRAATRFAVAWADCNDSPVGTCGSELSLYSPAPTMVNIAPQLTNSVALRMIEVTMSSTPTIVYASPMGATLSASELAAAQATIPNGQTGVVVTVSYVHKLIFFSNLIAPFLGASRTITYTVSQLKS